MNKEYKRPLRKLLIILFILLAGFGVGMIGALPIFSKDKEKFIEETNTEWVAEEIDEEEISSEEIKFG